MENKQLEKFADIARSMTGSTIGTKELFETIEQLDKETKLEIYRRTKLLIKENNSTFDKAYAPVKQELNEMAEELQIDPAVLFQTYIEEEGNPKNS